MIELKIALICGPCSKVVHHIEMDSEEEQTNLEWGIYPLTRRQRRQIREEQIGLQLEANRAENGRDSGEDSEMSDQEQQNNGGDWEQLEQANQQARPVAPARPGEERDGIVKINRNLLLKYNQPLKIGLDNANCKCSTFNSDFKLEDTFQCIGCSTCHQFECCLLSREELLMGENWDVQLDTYCLVCKNR